MVAFSCKTFRNFTEIIEMWILLFGDSGNQNDHRWDPLKFLDTSLSCPNDKEVQRVEMLSKIKDIKYNNPNRLLLY